MDDVAVEDGRINKWLAWMNSRPRLFLATCAILLATQTSSMWYPSPDGARYLSLAKSFSNFEPLALFGDPSIYVAPFYSFVISPFFMVTDRPFLLLSIFEWCLAMLLMWGVYRWAKLACPRWAVFLTCMVVLNHSVSLYYRRTLKETLFMALSIWVVNFLHVLLAGRSSRAKEIGALAGAASLLCMLTLTRYVALVFVAGFAICLFVQAYRKKNTYARACVLTVAVAAPPVAALYAWLAFTANFAQEGYLVAASLPYVEQTVVPSPQVTEVKTEAKAQPQAQPAATPPKSPTAPEPPTLQSKFRVHWGILWEGFRYRTSDLSRLLIPGMWKAPALQLDAAHLPFLGVYVPVALLCVYGWWRFARERADVLVYSAPFWILAYIHSSAEVYGRVFNPLLPVLCISFWFGLRTIMNSRRAATVMVVLFLGNLAQGTAFWVLLDRPKIVTAQQQWPVVDEMAAFLRQHPEPVAISDRVDHNVWLMLEFSLDREVQHPLTRRNLQSQAEWLIQHKSDPADPSLELRHSVGDYVILMPRRQQLAADARSTH